MSARFCPCGSSIVSQVGVVSFSLRQGCAVPTSLCCAALSRARIKNGSGWGGRGRATRGVSSVAVDDWRRLKEPLEGLLMAQGGELLGGDLHAAPLEGPDAPLVAVPSVLPAAVVRRPVAGADLHHHAAVDLRSVDAGVGLNDVDRAAAVDPEVASDLHELLDGRLPMGRHEVVPEHAGRPRVREDVGVALLDAVLREAPVALRGAGVVVLDKGARPRGPVAHDARGAAVLVRQPPVLLVLYDGVEDPLGRHVKREASAPGGIDPVYGPLSVAVLVVVEVVAAVAERIPELPDAEQGLGRLAVLSNKLAPVALGEVEAPPVESDLLAEPVEPLLDVVPHKVLLVVDVWRGVEDGARGVVPSAPEVGVVAHDRALVPVHLPAVFIPDALLVLELRASVVDHDVCEDAQADVVELAYRLL